jgi:histidine ammonia-lyase
VAILSTETSTAVVVTSDGVSSDEVHRVAVEGARVALGVDVEARLAAGRAVIDRAVDGDAVVYGLHTRLGRQRDERVPREELEEYQLDVLRGHVGGVGRPLGDEDVRAIMLARVTSAASGGSGLHPEYVHALVAMLNAGVHPLVPEVGSVGAADLMHLAAVGLAAVGEGEATFRGAVMPAREALARAGLERYRPRVKDGHSILSASSAAIGIGALVAVRAERVARLADAVTALSLEKYGGHTTPFDDEVVRAKPVPGQIEAAAHVRRLLTGSYLYEPGVTTTVQDPLCFRVMPQVHGAFREQVAAARAAVDLELNATDDNPYVSIARDTTLSTGNFHPMVLALAFDALRVGIAHVAMISDRRAGKWRDEDLTRFRNRPREDRPRARLVLNAAAALVGELKHLAAPLSIHAPTVEGDIEDHATLGPSTVFATRTAIGKLELVLAIEALLAVVALDTRPDLPCLGCGTKLVYEAVLDAFGTAGPVASTATVVEAVRETLLDRADLF